MLLDEAVDGGLEIDGGVEDPILQAATGQLGEEALDVTAQVVGQRGLRGAAVGDSSFGWRHPRFMF